MVNMRTLGGSFALALAFVACGGKELGPEEDGGASGSGDDAPSVTDGVGGETGTGAAGYCVYQTCTGLSLCGAGDTCDVGDGCNTCTCSAGAGGTNSTSCTSNGCSCSEAAK